MTRRTSRKPHPVPPGFTALPRSPSPYFHAIGKVYKRGGEAGTDPVYGLHVRPKHTNRYGTGHGGFLATLADYFAACFVYERRPETQSVRTKQLSLSYDSPVPMGAWLEAHLTDFQTKKSKFAVVTCELRIGDTAVSTVSATFSIRDKPAG